MNALYVALPDENQCGARLPAHVDDAEISEYAGGENNDQRVGLAVDEDRGEGVGPPVVVSGANPFSTAIRHFDFCPFCQNSVTTYINDAAGSSIAAVAISPPTMAPGRHRR